MYTALMKAAALGDEEAVTAELVAIKEGHRARAETAASRATTSDSTATRAPMTEEDEALGLFGRDRRGRTALDWARLGRHHECAQILEEAMAKDIQRRRNEAERSFEPSRQFYFFSSSSFSNWISIAK